MITETELISAGYRSFTWNEKYCIGAYQKVIYTNDGEKKKYFVNFFIWQFDVRSSLKGMNHITIDCRLYLSNDSKDSGGVVINPVLGPTWTIQDVEAFYEKAYLALGCVPDVNNN